MKHKYPIKAGHFYAIHEDTLAMDLMFEIQKDRSNVYDEGVCIINVSGPLDQHPSGLFDNYDDIIERLEEGAEDDDVTAIVFTFDSPGGDAYGMIQARKKIHKIAKQSGKPIYAFSNECCFSAAYGLASACDEIWVPQTGGVGSVGVVRPTKDESKAFERAGIKMTYVCVPQGKGLGRPGLPIDKATLDRLQDEVNQFGDLFFKGVSKSRGISVEEILALQANVFHGKKALKVGLADGIAGWDDFLAMVKQAHPSTQNSDSSPINGESDNGMQEPATMKPKKAAQTLLALNAKKTTMLQALAGSKSSDERVKLTAQLDTLIGEISAASQAAYKKTKKVEETEEQTDDEAEEEEEERCDDDEDEEDDDEESDDGSSDGGSSDGGSSSMSTDAEEKSSKAFLAAKSGLQTPARLLRLCRQVTGKNDIGEVFGALDAMGIRLKSAVKTEKRVAKLEASNRRVKVNALLNKASAEGKITPAQAPALREQGMKDYGWLKGYVATLAPRVNGEEVEYDLSTASAPTMASQVNMLGGSNVAMTDQQKILQAATSSMSGDETKLFGEVQKQVQAKHATLFNNGAKSGPRF